MSKEVKQNKPVAPSIRSRKASGHGSVTKAGKVRFQTPKIPAKPKRRLSPKLMNRRKFRLREILDKKPGQNWEI